MQRLAIALLTLTLLSSRSALAQTWEAVGPNDAALYVATDPSDPARVWAGTFDGLFGSTDGGSMWVERDNGLPDANGGQCTVQASAFDPDRPRQLYAGVGNRQNSFQGCGAFRGIGRGRRWRSLGIDDQNVSALAFVSGRPDVLWAGTAGDGGDVRGGIWKRVGHRPWTRTFSFLDVDTDITAFATDPRDGDTVYAASNNEGVLKTTDGGTSWTPANVGLPRFNFLGESSPTGAFIFTLPLVIDAHDPDTLYVGTLGFGSCCIDEVGIGGDAFTSHDGGATWSPSTSGLTALNVLALVSDPTVAGTVYAGTTNGVFRSQDSGATWSPFGLQGQLVRSLAESADGSALYAVTTTVNRLSLVSVESK
jgi:hypothetical protein